MMLPRDLVFDYSVPRGRLFDFFPAGIGTDFVLSIP
jgi:hypothetical protein